MKRTPTQNEMSLYADQLHHSNQRCNNCKQVCKSLYRYNEKGIEGEFWCELCLTKSEPELMRNHKEDGGNDITKIIEQTFN